MSSPARSSPASPPYRWIGLALLVALVAPGAHRLRVVPAGFSPAAAAAAEKDKAKAKEPAGPSGADIAAAIDKGIEWLLGEIEKKQIPDQHKAGQVALETYALVVAGVSVDHPLIRKNFDLLRKTQLNHTYTISCIAFALDAAMSQIEADRYFITGRMPRNIPGLRKYRSLLERCIKALVRIRQRPEKGSWNYGPGGNRFDNSNTQFAVLALGVGAKRGVRIPPEVWEEVAHHFISTQEEKGPEVKERIELRPPDKRGEKKDDIEIVERKRKRSSRHKRKKKEKDEENRGKTVVVKPVPEVGEIGKEEFKVYARGWSYDKDPKRAKTWNMTNAGVSSLILASQNLRGRLPRDFRNKLNRALRDGYGWIMQHWNPVPGGGWRYYGIYSLEKVGDLGEVKKFAGHDWYKEVSTHVVREQKADGSWPGENVEKARINTSFALLVLNRATRLLTQRASRMVITGPGAHQDDEDRDNWVYIQSLDRELHLPSLFRVLRLRPNPKLARFVQLVVKNYPPEKNGKLIPPLVKAYGQLSDKRFKKLLREELAAIAGVEYEDVARYTEWYERWKQVADIGDTIDRKRSDWLLETYRTAGESIPLRRKVIWAVARCQLKKAAPLLIADLDSSDESIRQAAYDALTTLPFARPVPPFDARARGKKHERQIAAIKAWYEAVS